jgi:hypothetical protein
MKKLFAVAVIVAALASPKAEAHPVLCAVPATGALPMTAAFMGGMAAFATLPIAIVELQDYRVWNQVFPSVVESFPGDKHFPLAQKAASKGVGKPYHVASIYGDSIRSDGF